MEIADLNVLLTVARRVEEGTTSASSRLKVGHGLLHTLLC